MHVSWQSEVNDDTALSTRGSERREVRCRDDRRGRCGAGNHYIRCREGCDEVDAGGEAETEGEAGGAAGRREHRNVLRSAVAEGGDGRRGILPGADDKHPRPGPVRDPTGGELKPESHERAAGTADRGLVLHFA